MRVVYHPEFAGDVRRYAEQYRAISSHLEQRFLYELDAALVAIKEEPTAAGHFVNTSSKIIRDVRRRNVGIFPFFVLYGLNEDILIFGSLIPSASDPLIWLSRFPSRK